MPPTALMHHAGDEGKNFTTGVQGFWFLVSGFWFLVSGFWFS
jgi:hypothetical protein